MNPTNVQALTVFMSQIFPLFRARHLHCKLTSSLDFNKYYYLIIIYSSVVGADWNWLLDKFPNLSPDEGIATCGFDSRLCICFICS